MKDKNALQLLQANLVENFVAFEVWGKCNRRELYIDIYIHKGDAWNVETLGKGVCITKTTRKELNERTGTYGYYEETKRVRIENKVGLKAFKAWIDSLKDYETAGFFTTKLFNY